MSKSHDSKWHMHPGFGEVQPESGPGEARASAVSRRSPHQSRQSAVLKQPDMLAKAESMPDKCRVWSTKLHPPGAMARVLHEYWVLATPCMSTG